MDSVAEPPSLAGASAIADSAGRWLLFPQPAANAKTPA
jgi:hypothetical protein